MGHGNTLCGGIKKAQEKNYEKCGLAASSCMKNMDCTYSDILIYFLLYTEQITVFAY